MPCSQEMEEVSCKIWQLLTWAHLVTRNSPKTQSNACGENTSSDESYREQHRATSDSASTTLAYAVKTYLVVEFLWSRHAVALVCGLHQRNISSY